MPSVRFVIHRGVPVAPDVAARLRAGEAVAMAIEADVMAADLADAEPAGAAVAAPEADDVPVPLLPPDPVVVTDLGLRPDLDEIAGLRPPVVAEPVPGPDLDLTPDLGLEPEPEPEPEREPEPGPEPLLPPDPVSEPDPEPEPLLPPEPVLDLVPEPAPGFDPEPAAESRPGSDSGPEPVPEPLPEADREHRSESAPAHRALVADLLPAPHRRIRIRIRRPRHRRGTGLPLVSVLVLAAVTLAGIGSWLAGRPDHQGPGTATGQPDIQRTALLLLRDSDEVVAGALLGVTGEDGVAVLIPSGLVLDVPGTGRQPLDAAYAARPTAPANALSDALGVRVDGTWVLSIAGLRALVDSVGGVTVDVDEDLTWHGVQLVQGRGQRLDGTSAAAFASADVAGEPEESQLARFGSVLGRLLAGLPPQQRTIGAQLAALGRESSDQLPSGRLAEMLWRARGVAQSDSWQGFVLPIQLTEVGDSRVQGLDAARARQLVERQLPGARIPEPSGGVVRVLVRNGVGVPKLSQSARDRLVAADLRFVAGGNADGFGRLSTVVLIASDSRIDRDRGERVARALGVRPGQIQVNPLGSAMADVVVVLGKDFADDVARHSVRG